MAGGGRDWPHEPCPDWCVRRHHEDDHPDDRRHQSRHVTIPVTVSPTAIPSDHVSTTDLTIGLDRPASSDDVWVRIEAAEEPQPRLAMTPASAQRLILHLSETLDQLGPADPS